MAIQLLLGTYTRGESEGIYSITLNPEKNELENLNRVAKVGSPTYVDTNDEQEIIFSIVAEDETGGILSLVKNEEGDYVRQSVVFDEGDSPCYIFYDEKRQLVYTANYGNGTLTVYKTDNEGNLEVVDMVQHEGSSVHENQDAPHAHYSNLSPDEKYLIACDLGTDKVYTYEISDEGKLSEKTHLSVEPGTGPRHLTFHPTLDVAYLVGELSSEVLVLDYDPVTGEFKVVQTLPTIPEDHTSFNSGAAIRVSPDGKFVYYSNRGHNSIAVFKTNQAGRLEHVENTPTEGDFPRDFNLDPSGEYLVVGHQHSDNLTLFQRDSEDGTLKLLQKDVYAPEVVCVDFI